MCIIHKTWGKGWFITHCPIPLSAKINNYVVRMQCSKGRGRNKFLLFSRCYCNVAENHFLIKHRHFCVCVYIRLFPIITEACFPFGQGLGYFSCVYSSRTKQWNSNLDNLFYSISKFNLKSRKFQLINQDIFRLI